MSELSIQVNYVKLICSAIIDPYHTILPWNVDDEADKSILLWRCLWFPLTCYIHNIWLCTNLHHSVFHELHRNFILYHIKTSIEIIVEAISFKTKKEYYQGVKRICTGSIMTIYSPEYDVNIILPAFYNHRLRLYIYWITPQILKFAWPFWSFLSLQECMFHPSALSRSDNVQT